MASEICFFVPSDRDGRPWYGLNDIIDMARKSRFGYAHQKDSAEKHVARIARMTMDEHLWVPPEGQCEVILTFVEMGRNRDPDNIFGGAKFILDALCEPTFHYVTKSGREVWRHKHGAGVIVDDDQQHVELRCALADRTDRKHPGVWVRIRRKDER